MKAWLLLALSVSLSGCTSRPTRSADTGRAETQELAREQFVNQRAAEVQQPGGTFSEPGNPESQPQEAARGRFDEVAEDVSTPSNAPSAKTDDAPQSEIDDALEKMEREPGSP